MEGNSDVADNSVIASDAKQSNDGDGDLQAQAVPINPWSIPNIADVYTVTFKVAGVNPDKKIEVAKDELCPKQTPPKATSGEVFSGWYYEDEIGNEQAFDFDTVKITKDLTITAHFAVTGHTVQFLSGTVDDNNSVVLYSASAADGGTLPEVSVDIPDKPESELVFTGKWLINGEAGNYFTFDNTQVNSNLKLAPEFAQGYHVYFVTNGKTAIEPQVVLDGATINTNPSVLPTPECDGYTFAGWYGDKDCNNPTFSGSEFSLSTQITESKTLYAKWTPETSQYRVVYWLEKPGIVSEAGQGQPLSLAQRMDTDNYELAYIEPTFRNELTGTIKTMISTDIVAGAKTAMNNILVNTNAAIEPFDFDHGETATINGANTSVINVYYTRAIYELKFQLSYPSGRSVGNTDVGLTINNQTYTPEDNSSDPYIFYAKVGENVEDVWPFITYVYANDKVSENPVAYLLAWYFGGSAGRGAGQPVFRSLYLDGLASNVRTAVFTTRAADWVVGPLYPFRLHYMGESFIQESGDGRILYNNGKYYEEFEHLDLSIDTANASHAAPKNGYTGIGVTYIVSAGMYRLEIRNPATTGTNNLFITRPTNSPVIPDQYGFYDRQSYKLTFDTQGGDAIAGYTGASKIPYEMPLADYEPATPSRGSDEFLGWYEDSNYFVPFSFDGSVGQPTTMPYKDLTLYAKWLVNPHTVRFFENGTATEPISALTQTVEDGKLATQPADLDNLADGTEFTGWYVKLANGTFMPYSFEMPITGDLDIYARWYPAYQPYEVVYDVGGATSGSVDADDNHYALGSKAIAHDGSSLKTADGKVFIGWKLGDSDILYHEGNKIAITNDLANAEQVITLTAQYANSSNAVAITFKRNTSKADSVSEKWSTVKNARVVYPNGSDLDGFSRIGYTFSGWATTSAGPVDSSYSSGNSGKLPNSLTLYAVWKPINYTVKYLPGTHGTFAEQITGGLHYSDLTPAAPEASGEAGWQFDVWDKTIASKVTGNATYTAVWKPIVYTVKYLPGTHGSFAEQVTGGLHYSDLTPAAPKTSSEAGWQFEGWDKTIASKVTGNATYTALWSEIPVESPIVNPPRPPRPPVVITPDPEPVVEDIAEPIEPEVPAPAPTITKESVDVRLANQTGNPILDLINGNVPLGGFASKGAWSLLSLLMSLVAVVVSVLLVVGIFMRRREDDDEEAERFDEDSEEDDRRRRGKILKTLTIIVGILTPIVWLILDNLNQPMVWINNWTVFVGITFIVHIILLIVYKLRKGNEEQEEEDNAEVA